MIPTGRWYQREFEIGRVVARERSLDLASAADPQVYDYLWQANGALVVVLGDRRRPILWSAGTSVFADERYYHDYGMRFVSCASLQNGYLSLKTATIY